MSDRKQLWVIIAIVFWGFIGISIPYIIFPALFLNPDYLILPLSSSHLTRAVFLGITLAAYPFGQFIGSPILGALSDDYGRKKVMSISLAIAAISNLFTGFSIGMHFVSLLIISRFITGVMEGNVAVARAMATELKSVSKPLALGRVNGAISIAYLFGPFIGGFLSDRSIYYLFTPVTPFLIVSVLFFVLAGLSQLVLKKTSLSAQRKAVSFTERINFIKRMQKLFLNHRLRFLLISSTIFTLAVDVFYEFNPVYLISKWMMGPSQLIYYNGFLCAGLAIGNGWLANYISKRSTMRKTFLWSIGGFATLLFGIVFTNSTYMMMALFGLIGLAIGITVTMVTVSISDAAEDRAQGEVLGVQLSLRVLGDGVICLIGGFLLAISSKLILGLAACMSLFALSYFFIKEKELYS